MPCTTSSDRRAEYAPAEALTEVHTYRRRTHVIGSGQVAEPKKRTRTATGGSSSPEPRETAHRLLDEVPAERVPAVVDLLRRELGKSEPGSVRRRFRTVGVFDGEPDLGRRSKEIARQELGGKPSKSA